MNIQHTPPPIDRAFVGTIRNVYIKESKKLSTGVYINGVIKNET